MQGYLQPKDFRTMFAFVADKGYERGTLRDYLKAAGLFSCVQIRCVSSCTTRDCQSGGALLQVALT
jgi:hypothetical protein